MAYMQGRPVAESAHLEPANPKMWNMYVAQAKARFRVYPSPTASSWVHAQYVQAGGKFVDNKSQVDPRFRDYANEDIKKKEALQKKKVKKPVGKGTRASRQFLPG